MTTAREQARKAVSDASNGALGHRIADAASEVWEPIVRDLLEAMECADVMLDSQTHDQWYEAFNRAKEALGL